MLRVGLLATCLLAACGPLAAQPEGNPMTEPVSTLTVRGTGEVRSAPDQAMVRLGVLAQDPSARTAQNRVSETAGRILDALVEAGVPRERIQTSELSLFPVYSQPDPRQARTEEPRITGYRATNVVTVTLDDLDRVGPAIDAGLGAGANRLEGLQFQLENDLPARQKALAQAVEEARRKADTIASTLGVRLVGVIEVIEGGVSVEPPRFKQAVMFARAESAMADTPVAEGEIAVSAEVTLRYRIE